MIVRIWHGVTLADRADDYFDYLKQTGLSDYEETPGNLGVHVLRRIEGQRAHFLLLSYWRSMADIEQFAGSDVSRARYYPQDEAYLLELEPEVTHYELLTPQPSPR